MANTREQALQQLAAEVNYYLHGFNDDTAVGKKYKTKLDEIKKAYYDVVHYRYEGVVCEDTSREKNGFKLAVIGMILWLVLFQFMPDKYGVQLTVLIALAIAAQIITKDGALGGAFIVVYIIGSWFSITKILLLIHMALVALFSWKNFRKKGNEFQKKNTVFNRGAVHLKQIQKELNDLLPEIRKELQFYADKWYEENASVLTEEDRKDFLGKDCPPGFWWQVDINDIYKIDEIFGCEKYGDWETKLVERNNKDEFDASEEYCPMYEPNPEIKGKISQYLNGEGKIYDIISRVTFLHSTAQTVQYQVPAHSGMERAWVNLSIMNFAHNVDKAYNEGAISYGEHRRLANEAFGLGLLAADFNNETTTESYTEYIPIRNHSNFWTGQIVVKKIQGVENMYGLYNYRCLLPHLFENLEAFHDLQIGYIDWDAWAYNPYFVARFYAEFPYAY